MRPQTDVLGLRVDRIGLAGTLERIADACTTGEALQIVTVNLNFVTIARRDPAFLRAVNSAGLAVADGRILLWITQALGEPVPEQVTGHDLVRECIPVARQCGWKVFLLGGPPGVAEEVAQGLRCKHPGLQIDATDGGRFAADGQAEQPAELVARIRKFAPQLLFVALGAPKQDLWIARHLAELGVPVAVGVGGVFDTLSGRLPRAPRWMQVAGLESLFQLLIEPRRYARRYLLDDPPTLLRAAWSVFTRRALRRDQDRLAR